MKPAFGVPGISVYRKDLLFFLKTTWELSGETPVQPEGKICLLWNELDVEEPILVFFYL